jgi:hypothetical protein
MGIIFSSDPIFIFEWLYSPCGSWPLFQFLDLFTIGRTPWTSDQLVTRSLPIHRATQTQNKHIYTPNIHALSGIRSHDHSVRASEDSSSATVIGQSLYYDLNILGVSGHTNIAIECLQVLSLSGSVYRSSHWWSYGGRPTGKHKENVEYVVSSPECRAKS